MGLTELDLSEVKMPGGNTERKGMLDPQFRQRFFFFLLLTQGETYPFLTASRAADTVSRKKKKKMTLQGMEINSEPLSPEGENAVAPPSGRLADTCGLWGGVCAPSISSGLTSTHNSTSLPGEPIVFA